MALQALALYSTRVFSRGGASTVTVRSPSGERCLFHVNQNNKLLYQERALQDTEGKYSVEVKGSACASVQVSEYTSLLPVLWRKMRFNIHYREDVCIWTGWFP